MNLVNPESDPHIAVASKASRATGAMFFTVFGGAWLGLWASDTFKPAWVAYGVIGLATLLLFVWVLRIYRLNKSALELEADLPAKRRQSRIFNIVNAGQWVLIVVLANVFGNVGLSVWILPMVMFIIGAHFVPLAWLFKYSPHYVTGAALMLVAVAYPLLANGGPQNAIGALATGLILWVSAAWAVKPSDGSSSGSLST